MFSNHKSYIFNLFFSLSVLMCLFLSVSDVQAQGKDKSLSLAEQSTQDMLLVAATSAGGAVMGLSTLSFYAVPSDHLRSIWVGASFGMIIGVAIVAMKQAAESQKIYTMPESYINDPQNRKKKNLIDSKNFNTASRISWHKNNFLKHQNLAFDFSRVDFFRYNF